MRSVLSYFTCVLLLCTASVRGQTSATYNNPQATYNDARMLFDAGAYGVAAERLRRYLGLSDAPGTAQHDEARVNAELLLALAAQRADLPEAAVLLESFIDRYSPQPVANEAIRQVAELAFADKDYTTAAEFYERLPESGLTPAQRDLVRFRLGYAAFVKKDFGTALRYFNGLRNRAGEQREAATYYYALAEYYDGDNAAALKAFESLSESKKYGKVIPGYLAQIYFAEGKYEELIAYAVPAVDAPGVRQQDEIHLLIGRALFELGRYEEALPHLEAYAASNQEMSAEDFYQLGYAQYVSGAYEAAAGNLRQLGGEDSQLAQASLYYFGNSRLHLNQREEARPAFASVSRMDYDPQLKAEAAWNVAKLNYELGYDQEALVALQAVPDSSSHYAEAQGLLSRVILKSRDYERALGILDGMTELTPELREARQRVLVLRGLQLVQAREEAAAKTLLTRSLEGPGDRYYEAIANYWLGDIAYADGAHKTAVKHLGRFVELAKAVDQPLPEDSNLGTAQYLLGYSYLKQNDFRSALGHFQEAVAGLRRRISLGSDSRPLANMLGDAVVRAGDANFKKNDYTAALKFYDEAIDKKYQGYIYALYQKAIIEGLSGNSAQKIIALETIVDKYPKSDFADDALFELGATYLSINQLKRSGQVLERLVNDYKGSALRNDALIQLGLVSYNQGSTQTAIDYYKQVFANNPRAEEVRVAQQNLQEIYVDDLGKPNEYLAFLETVPGVKLDNSVRDSINFASAQNKYQEGDYTEAVDQYTSYLNNYPGGGYAVEALYRRADAYLVQRKYKEALSDFESIVQRGAGQYYTEALTKAARIAYDSERDFEKASRYYNKVIEDAGDQASPELRLMALRASYRSGDAKAVYGLTQQINADPNASEPTRAIASFYDGKVAYDRKDYDRALASFDRVVEVDDGEAAAEARYLTGRIYYLQRNLEKAKEVAISAQRKSSGHPFWVARSVLLLTDVFVDQGDLLSARAVAEGLVENYRGNEKLEAEAKKKLAEVTRAMDAASKVRPTDDGKLDLVEPENR